MVVTITVGDLLCSHFIHNPITQYSQKVLHLADFCLRYPSNEHKPKALEAFLWFRYKSQALAQWAVIFGHVSPTGSIFPSFKTYFLPLIYFVHFFPPNLTPFLVLAFGPKDMVSQGLMSIKQGIGMYSLRYLRLSTSNDKACQESVQIIEKLINFIKEGVKSPAAVKVYFQVRTVFRMFFFGAVRLISAVFGCLC